MSKITSILLGLLILISSTGINLNIHDCNYCGRSYNIFYNKDVDLCCESHINHHHKQHIADNITHTNCCNHSSACNQESKPTESKCCNDEFKFLKYEPKYFEKNHIKIYIVKQICLFNVLLDDILHNLNNNQLFSFVKANPPPLLKVGYDFLISVHQLKIYLS